MIVSLLLLMQVATPSPGMFATPPVSVSERATIDRALNDAQSSAQALGGFLGASVVDLTTGVDAETNGEQPFSMGGVQKLPVAVLVYRAVDAGALDLSQQVQILASDLDRSSGTIAAHFPDDSAYTIEQLIAAMLVQDDGTAENALMRTMYGSSELNSSLHTLGFDGIFIAAREGGYASPVALTHFLSEVTTDTVLKNQSSIDLLKTLAQVQGGSLRDGLPQQTLLQHVTGRIEVDGVVRVTNEAGIAHIPGHTLLIAAMLRDAGGTDKQRNAVIAQVARAAVAGATVTPGATP